MSDSRSFKNSRRPSAVAAILKSCAAFAAAGALAAASLIGGATSAAAAPGDLTIADIHFGEVHVGTSNEFTFTLKNSSATESQDITGLMFASMGETQTSITDDRCALVTSLAPGATCDIVVDFHPTVIEAVFTHGIRGTLGGTSFTGYLRGNTIASMQALDGLALDFGQVPVGEQATRELLLTNTSDQTITVSAASGGAGGGTNDPFTRTADCAGEVLAPGGQCTLVYAFTPIAPGTFAQAAPLTNVGVLGSHFSPELKGEGVAVWSVTPDDIDFGAVPAGLTVFEDITVTNVSGQVQEMPPMSSRDFNSFIFTTLDCITGVVFQPGESCTVTLSFTPMSAGPQQTNWDSGFQIGNIKFPIAAKGVGFLEPDHDMWQMDPLALDFGEVTVGESATLTSTLTFVGEGVGIVFPKYIRLGSPFAVDFDCEPYASLATGEQCTITVTFTPADEGVYSQSATVRYYGSEFELSAAGTGVVEAVDPDEDPVDPDEDPVEPTDPGAGPADIDGPADQEQPTAPAPQPSAQSPAHDTLVRTGSPDPLEALGSVIALLLLGGSLLLTLGRRSSAR